MFRAIRKYVNTHHESEAFDLQASQRKPLDTFYINLGVTQSNNTLHRIAVGSLQPVSPENFNIESSLYEEFRALYSAIGPIVDLPALFLERNDLPNEIAQANIVSESSPYQLNKAKIQSAFNLTKIKRLQFEKFIDRLEDRLKTAASPPIAGGAGCSAVEAVRLLSNCDLFVEMLQARCPSRVTNEQFESDTRRYIEVNEVDAESLLSLEDNLCIFGDAGAGKTCVARNLARP
jgi:hypothetical protein